ncbi:hypothetical protein V8D89_014352 [Ganoderma adspersum]
MTSQVQKIRLRLAHRVPADTSPISASGTYGPIVVDAPSSFTECIPPNITWTGGITPYSLLINVRDSSQILRQFDGINTTHFVWSPDVPAETLVSLQVMDARTVLTLIEDPILVGEKPLGASCEVPTTNIPSQIPSPIPSMRADPRQNPSTRSSTIAGTVVAVVLFLFLATSLWWQFRVRARQRLRRKNQNNTEKEVMRDGDNTGGLGEHKGGDGAVNGRSVDPENTIYTEDIFTASPMSDTRDRTPTQSPSIGSLPSSPRTTNTQAAAPTQPLRPKAAPQSRSSSMYMQSDSETRVLPDTDFARLSISTSSTLPPSYRTRSSAGSIYIPTPNYPPFPPPVYAPTDELVHLPPSAFSPLWRVPPRMRRRLARTPPKVFHTQRTTQRMTSEEWGSSLEDGLWRTGSTDLRRRKQLQIRLHIRVEKMSWKV